MRAGPVKLGLVIPQPNVTMEPELLGWLPPGASLDMRRIPSLGREMLVEDMPDYDARVLASASTIDEDVDGIIYGCTSGGFMTGADNEMALVSSIEKATGKSCVSTARAVVEALQSDGAKRIGLLSPYPDATNAALIAYLRDFEIAVAALSAVDPKQLGGYGAIRIDDVTRLAHQAVKSDCDALFIACSHMPTFAAMRSLHQNLGMPVYSSISATARKILAGMGREIVYA
jgi:maleate cis-trans isomerase